MLFPRLQDLATTEVIWIEDTASVAQALELMQKHQLRALIVHAARGYRLLLARDLVAFHLQGMDFSVPLSQVHLPLVLKLPSDAPVEEAIRLISLHQAEQVCLIDAEGELYGIVSYTDLIQSLDPELLAETQSLGDLLRGSRVLQVNREMPAQVAFALMQQEGVNTLLVSEESVPLGIVTQTDVIRLLQQGVDLVQPIEQLMSSPVFTLAASISVQQALLTIRERGFKRLVVVNQQGRVIGLISQQDLVSTYYNQWLALLRQQQAELQQANQTLQQQNQLLALLLNEFQHPVLVSDTQGRVKYINQAAQAYLGVSELSSACLADALARHAESAQLEQFLLSLQLEQTAALRLNSAGTLDSTQMQLKARPLLKGEEPLVMLTFTQLESRVF